jgi:phosphate-selective porin OprO/OprP
MEYALPFALVPDRKMGMMANNAVLNERMTWAVGMFRNSDQDGFKSGQDLSDKGYNVTGRVTGLPWYENNGKQLLHLGAAYSFRTPNDAGTVNYYARPEAHLAEKFLDVTVDDDHSNLFGGEVAGVWNSFHAESEFIASTVDTKIDGNPCYKGMYAQAGYFLTGETRPYNKSTGTFGHVSPLKNFRDGNGLGAWEIAARYSYLDLDQDKYGAGTRGELQDVTIGLNWYLNPNMRIMWNYIHAMPDTPVLSSAADIFMMRFQIDF